MMAEKNDKRVKKSTIHLIYWIQKNIFHRHEQTMSMMFGSEKMIEKSDPIKIPTFHQYTMEDFHFVYLIQLNSLQNFIPFPIRHISHSTSNHICTCTTLE
jgi:hypothetical protein